MDAAAPVFDEALLDALARVFMRAALDDLMREQQQVDDDEEAKTERGPAGPNTSKEKRT